MKKKTGMLLAAALLLLPVSAGADIYRWKDESGVMHFSNQPPPEGVTVIEKIEEAPYDAEADRRRIEEERRMRLERQRLEIEERRAAAALREREAQNRLADADRRLEEARRLEQEAQLRKTEECDDDYYLRTGTCLGHRASGIKRYDSRPARRSDLYRGYYRDNNSLYYKNPPRPARQPDAPPAWKHKEKPAPRPRAPQAGTPLAPEELPPAESAAPAPR